ncbi:hypothetical protein EON62_06370, partial [archaeon]
MLALDEVTNGLDSSTALNIISYLTKWAATSRGTLVVALQQNGREDECRDQGHQRQDEEVDSNRPRRRATPTRNSTALSRARPVS